MNRRALLTAPAALAALALPVGTKADSDISTPARNMPFVMPLADDPDIVALCVPASKITHAFRYMLADGRTIYGEHGRCNDGSGWRDVMPGEWDGRIVGRIVTMLVRQGSGWSEMGRGELAG